MKEKIRKIAEIALFVFIIFLSVVVFLNREKIGNVGNIGYLGLTALCFLANSTVFLPAPSLMVAVSCGTVMNPWLVAFFGALGTSLGELVGYLFGAVSKDISKKMKDFLDKCMEKLKNPYILVFLLALLPLPFFDFAGIYSGGTRMKVPVFFGVCFLGKFIKFVVYVLGAQYFVGSML